MRFSKIGMLLSSVLFSINAYAQHENHLIDPHLKNVIAPLVGYAIVPEETSFENDPELHIIPTFGVDYIRKLNRKWAIGLFNDIELTSYYIKDESSHENLLKREFAFVSALCLIYQPIEFWSIYTGVGYEFERHKNFAVFRLGTEYEIPIRNNWAVSFGLCWDHKSVYNSVGLSIAFAKYF